MVKRIVPGESCGLIVDVQRLFLSKLDRRRRSGILANAKGLLELFGHFDIPVILTLERPIGKKGGVPKDLKASLSGKAEIHEKSFFDLSRETEIADRLRGLARRQLILCGCETDVCVLQSCLGLLHLGYEVYVVEDLLFSASRNVESAIARMRAEGATFLTYKTLYFELLRSVEGGAANASIPLPPEPR